MLKDWCSEAACRPKESMGKGYPKDDHKSFPKWPVERNKGEMGLEADSSGSSSIIERQHKSLGLWHKTGNDG